MLRVAFIALLSMFVFAQSMVSAATDAPSLTDEDAFFSDKAESWEDVAAQIGLYFVMVLTAGTEEETQKGAFSYEYSEIRDTVLTKLGRVRANKSRIDELITFQSQLIQSYQSSGIWTGTQNNDKNCNDNAILCKLLPYTFDQIQWD